MSLWPDGLVPHPRPGVLNDAPRATLILPRGERGLLASLYMGGAESVAGLPLREAELSDAWLIDCAGDLPDRYRTAAGLFLSCVFPDLEAWPGSLERLHTLAAALGSAMLSGDPAASIALGQANTLPGRIYVMCQQGMNRSGLLTGLILRAAGMPGEAALALLRHRRPGCLSNQSFERLVLDGM